METTTSPYPLRLTGELAPGLSRWLWLVKWLLAIPHFVVLFFLWIAFVVPERGRVLRDPVHRPLPARDLRLQRRCAALDLARRLLLLQRARHRPLPAVHARRRPGLPGAARRRLPEPLSRGLVLVKWWLLALPHYLVVAVFAGGAWAGSTRQRRLGHGPPAAA